MIHQQVRPREPALPSDALGHPHSIFAPDSLTTFAHLAMSARMIAAN